MAQDTRGSKRKSTDSTPVAVKKAKTAPSSEKPAPLKSALKKTKGETSEAKKQVVAGKEVKKSRDGKKQVAAPVEAAATPAIAKDEVELKTAETKSDKRAKASKKSAKPAKATESTKPAPVLEDHEEEDDETSTQLSADRTAELLAGFSSSEDEAEDDGVPEDDGLALSTLPSIPDVKADLLRLTNNPSSKDPENTPGTIIISRLPHGFFESQMRAYFAQFGAITHLRLARNKKTGKSKHFAFVEFASSNVADIVAKTMDKYLLFGHILQVQRVSDETIGDGTEFWRGEGKERVVPRNKLEGARLRRGMGKEAWEKRVTREEGRRDAKKAKLAEMGYEFEMPEVKGLEEIKGIEASEVSGEVKAIEAAPAPAKAEDIVEKTKKRPAAEKEAKAPKSKKARKSV